jgi:hypothetical protein
MVQLGNELLGGRALQGSLHDARRRDWDRGIPVLDIGSLSLELLDDRVCLGLRELAKSLSLRQAKWPARTAEVGMPSLFEEGQELLHLLRGRRWADLLTECHRSQSDRQWPMARSSALYDAGRIASRTVRISSP